MFKSASRRLPLWLIALLAFLGVLGLIRLWQGDAFGGGALVAAAAIIALGYAALARFWRVHGEAQARADALAEQTRLAEQRLDMLRKFDADQQSASTEQDIMQAALGAAAGLSGARGASFVPLDEWGQALPATTSGDLPAQMLQAWNERAGSHTTRATCRACQALSAAPGSKCPMACSPFEQSEVVCLPLERGARLVGMINLYDPDHPEIDDVLASTLKILFNQATTAIENMRLRQREGAALQQSQALRAPGVDLTGLLGALLDGLCQAVDASGARLVVAQREDRGGWLPALDLSSGASAETVGLAAETLIRETVAAGSAVQTNPGLAAAALALPDGRSLGAIILSGAAGLMTDTHTQAILRSVSGQAAMLIENERELLTLEYRAVVQERARLAREIHDGLAQTLAFLKLQTAQMQIHLAQGEISKLSQALTQNYEALSEAYMETRQAIDDLRITPRQGLLDGLDALLDDFETSSGLAVERAFGTITRELSPEVQIQVVRIVQEALANVRKHANAGAVSVGLRAWNGDLVIEVSDNGKGFQPEELPGLSQHGLRGMRERAELIGADFQVISSTRQGTTIRLSFPLQPEETLS